NQMLNDPTGANEVMDDELRVLQARDPDTGVPFATILNLNAHPTVIGSSNLKATGDWPQFANKLMTQDGATFGTKALTIVGTLGRQQPARGDCPDKVLAAKGDSDAQAAICKATQYAARVIARAKEVALPAAKLIDGKPEVVAKTYFIQDPATNAGIMALNDVGEAGGAPIMRSNTPPWRTGNVVGSVTGTARIGNVILSSMPGEAYPQIPLDVRAGLEDSGIKGFMTAGLSNDQLGYIIANMPEAYPQVLIRGAQGNDNILFNMSQTLGERLTCSLLRGAGEVTDKGTTYRDANPRCTAFANDLAWGEGADVGTFPF
ncbi:MAG: Neutral/alkaline non-lysosomal ceramidase, N-terminal, partial [Thermoleophilaceae bacterium]|nr:Neutral/alkaline non-lysosomal ceramidase, N-terminal [Thermoleophilaceae bacterium]